MSESCVWCSTLVDVFRIFILISHILRFTQTRQVLTASVNVFLFGRLAYPHCVSGTRHRLLGRIGFPGSQGSVGIHYSQ
jgi:hypothetical protein